MSQSVRNFRIQLSVDAALVGTNVTVGPTLERGGFSLVIHMREDGEVITPLYVDGMAGPEGRLFLSVSDDEGVIWQKATQR